MQALKNAQAEPLGLSVTRSLTGAERAGSSQGLWASCGPRYRSTMERMSSVAERLRSLQMDDEEAQRLQLLRKAEA